MIIEEKFVTSKTGLLSDCEDDIFINEKFVAVIDGATSKLNEKLNGITSGKFATNKICEALQNIHSEMNEYDLLCHLNIYLKKEALKVGFVELPSASVVIFDVAQSKIICYGDCKFMVDGKEYIQKKLLDERLARKRARYIDNALKNGKTVDEFLQHDEGRQFILPDLKEQGKFANSVTQYGYPVINGGKIVKEFIKIYTIEKNCEIVFASDGYPFLKNTLAESEKCLERIIAHDPLCVKKYISTKGLMKGQISFDDRSYIRFIV